MFVILRALYGIGMGGYWGIGASLVMESSPPRLRGLFSGIMQAGYSLGYLLAAAAIPLVGRSTGLSASAAFSRSLAGTRRTLCTWFCS